ncbi:MAG: 30S ribosomal protein S20 [Halothiobacillus sp. 24-54-40]|nr:30S ribosomal protein S20 [Halothiobacillaceae bacterium]OYV47039.1 MAG: 30S ribosomal protein S20 [Halothiobacillus sp. 20-53-49]OYY39437.1 MAG: 30S ribosomal protein S20 [Halothiobacillus sp. 35-54-62]OYY51285.1 MAG: 30S ribosomal protein S20 [Halothiobacillus sp. 28-55-5]OYZ86821.1 MAG: 30S ribosomal protein S20 [Halothiobacillus sp. 24-54-40]OZA80995.1 MAG: 30S ribosomal protein S20 [Halothiobacillus sp. 39-53-45]HQS02537.1 30S ribosomal protein S20 [Halothiobacillus sp.]
MANTAQAKKRVRQAEQARQRNMALRTRVRTEYKKVLKAIATGSVEQAKAAYQGAQPIIDGMVNKGILAKNTAARRKSTLVKRIKALSVAA